jgi:hypothetical protein
VKGADSVEGLADSCIRDRGDIYVPVCGDSPVGVGEVLESSREYLVVECSCHRGIPCQWYGSEQACV